LVPDAIKPGGPDFTLTVNGTGFAAGARVHWNRTALTTTFVSGSQLTATVPAAHIAHGGTASVRVVNPGPGGASSNVAFVEATLPTTSIGWQSALGTVAGRNPWSIVMSELGQSPPKFTNAS
jgi:hypothetical protein